MKTFKKILVASSVFFIVFALVSFKSSYSDKLFEISKNIEIFAALYNEVNTHYVDEINPTELINTGIIAMLESLDPYTNFIPEDDIENYKTMTTGQYGGIGAIIGKRNNKTMVLMPYEGFPAFKSGLQIGDEIIAIDGIDVTTRNTDEISKLLKGQANTDLNITIKRYDQEKPIVLKLKREKITINNVPYYGMVDNTVGYVKLTDFTRNASKEVKKALQELKEKGAQKIIFDLRGNPGGLLSEAVNISNLFIPKGKEVVFTKGKIEEQNRSYKALNAPFDTDIPIAILTSSGSASASEIVSGVIQDYDRGVLIGQKTFGKGLVQATRPLVYNSQVKITISKYHIPSGRCIQAIDYSNRNPDGSIGKIADSLKVEFKTENGRTVYDGGGVDPDFVVERSNLAPITTSLITKNLLFDYATEYYYNNSKISDSRSFEISNQEYEKFISWLQNKDYDYTTKVEKNIESLIKEAKNEKYYDEIKGQIQALKTKVHHNKESDLKKFKEEIKQYLKSEIVSRYFYQSGIIQASFDTDPDIQKALEVFHDETLYNKILNKN